jgi:hypothetical protein
MPRPGGVVAWINEWGAIPPTLCELCDTDGERATQLQHAIHDMRGDGNLSGAKLVFSKAEPVADYLLAPPDGGLNAAALVVPDIFCQPIRPFSAIHWRWRSR